MDTVSRRVRFSSFVVSRSCWTRVASSSTLRLEHCRVVVRALPIDGWSVTDRSTDRQGSWDRNCDYLFLIFLQLQARFRGHYMTLGNSVETVSRTVACGFLPPLPTALVRCVSLFFRLCRQSITDRSLGYFRPTDRPTELRQILGLVFVTLAVKVGRSTKTNTSDRLLTLVVLVSYSAVGVRAGRALVWMRVVSSSTLPLWYSKYRPIEFENL